jgi:predicted nuclease of predicted toxin-antitoxin system
VRFLFDQNLSRHLVGQLRDSVPDCQHVTDVGLDTATDEEIWSHARESDLVICSKDSDFRQLAFLHGPPPKVVWLRLGNASTSEIHRVIVDHLDVIEAFVESEDEALLVLPDSRMRELT